MTVVCDLERATVKHVAEDRQAESLQAFWQSLSPEQLDGVDVVSMDIWAPYIQGSMQCVPDADQKSSLIAFISRAIWSRPWIR